MRQVGTLSTERQARQFAAWLVAQRIEAHAEEESGAWVVWVRDEDHLARAREELAHFRDHPGDAKYQGAEQSAETARREEEVRRRQAQGNVVEMRGRWASGPGMPGTPRRSPIVWLLIGLSALVALLTWGDTMEGGPQRKPPGTVSRALAFVDPAAAITADERIDIWASIRTGEVWRLVTPIFLHFDMMHIVFNMLVLYSFGSAIEDRRGSLFMVALVLGLAVLSNVGQAIETSWRDQVPGFGGMSGVDYGLFGYIAVKAKFDSQERYVLSPMTTMMAMLWFVLCILRDIPPFASLLVGVIPPIANTCHAVGLLAGAAIAYAPLLARKPA